MTIRDDQNQDSIGRNKSWASRDKQVWLTICCPKTWLKVSPKTGESEIKSLAHSERTWLTPKRKKKTTQLGVVTTKNKLQIYRKYYMHPYIAQLCWYCWQSSWKRILRRTGYPKQMYLIKITNKVHYLGENIIQIRCCERKRIPELNPFACFVKHHLTCLKHKTVHLKS